MSALALTNVGLLVYGQGYQDEYTSKDALFLRNCASGDCEGGRYEAGQQS